MLPPPHQKPYTLLLSLDDLLVTSTWDVSSSIVLFVLFFTLFVLITSQRQHGWRTAKRPGVDYFIAYLSQFYEIVIFTTQHHYVRNNLLPEYTYLSNDTVDCDADPRKVGSIQLLYYVQALPRGYAQHRERPSEGFVIS